jgi:hypothetical protein
MHCCRRYYGLRLTGHAKCDRKLPCSQCIAAKVECTGFSNAASSDLPRSIVIYLEDEIARLEGDLGAAGHLDDIQASEVLLQIPTSSDDPREAEHQGETRSSPQSHNVEQAILQTQALRSMISATLPYGPGLIDLIRMGLTPSSARAVASSDESRRSINSPNSERARRSSGANIVSSMPIEIIQTLTRNFVQKVLPQYPILPEETIWQGLELLSSLPAAMGDLHEKFVGQGSVCKKLLVIHLVLAISVTLGSAKGGHEGRCMALSSSLFDEGLQYLYRHPRYGDDIAGLQANLLILLYATINPRCANVWVLSGAAMRTCLELGLHRHQTDKSDAGDSANQLHQNLFWVAYSMDRSICSAVQRPLSIPDAAIDTELPSLASGNSSGANVEFLDLTNYHRLLSEMTEIHFQGAELPSGVSWDDWLSTMEHKLRAWYAQSLQHSSQSHTAEFALARGLTILHRPSPRIPIPSQRGLLLAFEAASSAAQSHRDHIQSGFFRRPWLSAHHMLEGAVIVLFCLRHAGDSISKKFNASQIFERTKVFTANFLAIASQGWPEVSSYAGIYERLLGLLMEPVFSTGKVSAHRFGPAEDAELTRLLYPGPAHLEKLRRGSKYAVHAADLDTTFFDFEDDFFDFGSTYTGQGLEDGFDIAGTSLLDHGIGANEFSLNV